MHTATLSLSRPGTAHTTRYTAQGSRETIAKRFANLLREYATHFGLSPLAVDYAVQLH